MGKNCSSESIGARRFVTFVEPDFKVRSEIERLKTAVSIELSQGTSRQSDRQTQDTRSLSLAAGGTEKALPQRAAARAHCSNLSVVDVTQSSRRALPCYFPGNRHDARADAGIKAIPSSPHREWRNGWRHRTVEHSAMLGFQNSGQHIQNAYYARWY